MILNLLPDTHVSFLMRRGLLFGGQRKVNSGKSRPAREKETHEKELGDKDIWHL